MNDEKIIYIDSPLKGIWLAPHTPSDQIPSHGTDALGQRYAYDFIQIDFESKHKLKFYRSSVLKYWTVGVSLKACYCYQAPIYAGVFGKVVKVVDEFREPKRLHPILDPMKVFLRTMSISFKQFFVKDINKLVNKFIGNYVIVEFDEGFAFYAHTSPGSIGVKVGDRVKPHDIIAAVGHSGNSTAPHLHFQVMDRKDLINAKGIHTGFKQYQVINNKTVISKENDIPLKDEKIKF